MTCGGCSGAVERVLKKTEGEHRNLICRGTAQTQTIILLRRHFLRYLAREAGSYRQGQHRVRYSAREDQEDWQGGGPLARICLSLVLTDTMFQVISGEVVEEPAPAAL